MKLVCRNYHETLNQYLMDFREKIDISFEFFPPSKTTLQTNLWNTIDKLKLLKPKFFSVTCGANFGVQTNTYDVVRKIKDSTGIDTVPHMTCINMTKDELIRTSKTYWNNGIRHILALRGDVPNFHSKPVMYAVDLINLLKSVADFDISVAVYPEMHPESTSIECEIINLKKKIEAGATRAITQFFFSVNHFLRFRDLCVKNNITIDIIPGIFPIVNFKQLCKFSDISNVNLPKWLRHMFFGLENDIDTSRIIGVNIAIDMVKVLYSEGVRSFHFYTLNRSESSYAACHILGINPK